MTRRLSRGILAAGLTLVLASCGDEKTTGDADGDAESDATEDVQAEDVQAEDVPGEEVPVGPSAATLPQAVSGALWANPEVYPTIPLHVVVTGPADSVAASIDGGAATDAGDPDGDGEWIALVDISALADGEHDIVVEASADGAPPVEATATLVTGTEGVQVTSFGVDGMAGVPRLHRVGDEAWLTWTDRSAGDAEAWLQAVDGAGRFLGDRTALVEAGEEALYARTAVGPDTVGVLWQGHGSPYTNRFEIVDHDGAEVVAAVDLDPAGWYGSFDGDVVWDGSGYVIVWRSHDGDAASEIGWMRVEDGTWAITGPVVVAEAGPGTTGDPIGGFDPFVFVDVRAVGSTSMVSWVQDVWDDLLAMAIPKSFLALVADDGTVISSEQSVASTSDFFFHRECRTSVVDGTFVAVWSAVNLMDPSTNPPNLLYATRTGTDLELDPGRGFGTLVFDAVDDRDEPFLAPHPEHLGVLAWWDHRAYTEDPAHGRIELFAAPLDADLTASDEVIFPHARTVAGTSHLWAMPAGTNVILVWRDERHGSGILDPRPELYMETVWL